MKHLNSDPHFLEAAAKIGCNTQKGAETRLFQILGNANARPLTFVIRIGDKFLPVAVVSEHTSGWADQLARRGVYVTNA